MSRVVILRHGNTFDAGETVRRVGGRTDLPLSSSGRAQAAALARRFAEAGTAFTSARCGPLRRTRETAETILAAQSGPPPLIVAPFLREIDYGPDEDRPEAEVEARLGSSALAAWEAEARVPDGWRVDPAALIGGWELLFAELRGQPGAHLVVTSNGVARFALNAAGETSRPGKLATAAWGVVALGADGSAAVEDWNVRVAAAG